MWIRSQDKERLLNIEDLFIKEKDEKGMYKIVVYAKGFIGSYSTKEKALKVLDMIEQFINCSEEYKAQGEYKREIVSCCNEINRLKTFVFQMPQDKDL